MEAGTLILLLLLLACPLAMFFMHGRGGHGSHAHGVRTTGHGSRAGEARNGHAGHGCGHSGHGHGGSIDEPVRKRGERETAGVDSPAR